MPGNGQVRACIVGGGLAGSLLAWRLATASRSWRIDLVTGHHSRADATAASGGAVRAFEAHPEQRRLAAMSMVELLGSRTLRLWADFRRVESVYLPDGAGPLDDAIADIDQLLPGSASLVPAVELAKLGWTGVDDHPGFAVMERRAGYVSPDRLRNSVLADGEVRSRMSVHTGPVGRIEPRPDGGVRCVVDGRPRDYDVVVLATGAWTGAVLRNNGYPDTDFRVQSIQYSVYRTGSWRPPMFVDERIGVFGRPTTDGGLLLGRPTGLWSVDPDVPPTTPHLHDSAATLATARFPRLRLGGVVRRVSSADCYADAPILGLRPVTDQQHRLFTFTGGSGGSVKTALAASHRAAVQLIGSGQPTELVTVGRRIG
ncbi:MAG: NAD(P)/FAD-dependent oxidoreductase [Actinophytocola sp.]|uniref:NAD(P)/FAD-dependent oxidoreductase n=1 Tax=Actinophytocola sp. TaxID=1872138 RepID=UPI003D6C6EBC